MTFRECCQLIKEDYARVAFMKPTRNPIKIASRAFLDDSFCVTFWFRIGSYLKSKRNFIAKIVIFPIKVVYIINTHFVGIQLPLLTSVKGGVKFFHYGTVIIAGSVRIGKNASIHQGVTIGRTFGGKKAGVPTIGDRVVIFAGAKLVGNIKIGNDVVIGAGAVVIDDVPDNAVVVGCPAKIISTNSSKAIQGEYWRKCFGLLIN